MYIAKIMTYFQIFLQIVSQNLVLGKRWRRHHILLECRCHVALIAGVAFGPRYEDQSEVVGGRFGQELFNIGTAVIADSIGV